MKLITFFILLSTISYSQMKLHNTTIFIRSGNVNVFSDIEGEGTIEILNSNFKAQKISCDIKVNTQYSYVEYLQVCEPKLINKSFKLYDFTGKYLGYYNNPNFDFLPHNTPLIAIYDNGYIRKFFIKR